MIRRLGLTILSHSESNLPCDTLVDTLYAPRQADRAFRLRHCRKASEGQKRDPY